MIYCLVMILGWFMIIAIISFIVDVFEDEKAIDKNIEVNKIMGG